MQSFSRSEQAKIERLLAALSTLEADVGRDPPYQMVRLFLLTALLDGTEQADMAELKKRTGLSQSVVSRHILDMGERNRYKDEGHMLVDMRPKPTDRRYHEVSLTARGRALVHKMLIALGLGEDLTPEAVLARLEVAEAENRRLREELKLAEAKTKTSHRAH